MSVIRREVEASAPAPKVQSRGSRVFMLVSVGVLVGLGCAIGVDLALGRPIQDWASAQLPTPSVPAEPTVQQMLLMSDADLGRYHAADLNTLVAREAGVPADLVVVHSTIAEWAKKLRPINTPTVGLAASTQTEAFWTQVVADLQRQMEIKIVKAAATSKEAKDLFLAAALQEKRFTPNTLPLLLESISREWGQPLALAADNDRLVCRLQSPGGSAANLVFDEKGAANPSDQQLIRLHGIPAQALKNGSDLQPLTNRQLLAWFLGQRSGVFLNAGDLVKAEADLLLARTVFPENRSLFLRMTQLMERRGPQVLGATAWAMLRGDSDPTSAMGVPGIPRTAEEVMQLNQRNRRSPGFSDPMAGLPDIMNPHGDHGP
jgi:hypothetical protein